VRFWTPALLLTLSLAVPATCASTIQRYLISLKLGDTMKEIHAVYPPKKKWRKSKERNTRLTRILIEKGSSKWFPGNVGAVRLGMRRGKLAHLQVVYNRDYSRKKTVGELVRDYSLIYGEPRRYGDSYFWWDSETVLAVSNAEVKTAKGVEFRTRLELMEKGYFEPFRN
jgi:hypothetical protein